MEIYFQTKVPKYQKLITNHLLGGFKLLDIFLTTNALVCKQLAQNYVQNLAFYLTELSNKRINLQGTVKVDQVL